MRVITLIALVCMVAVLGACASKPEAHTGRQGEDSVTSLLDRNAQKIASSLSQMARLWQANARRPAHIKKPESGPLTTPIDLLWDGPAEQAVRAVARLIGYQVKILGEAPPAPITISINASGEQAFSVLRNIGWQAGKRVGVTIEPDQKTIVVTFQRS
jgi:defect-in-organelle-trafficking protein DotD